MRIAIDCRGWWAGDTGEFLFGRYMLEPLLKQAPGHSWLLISDKKPAMTPDLPEGCRLVVMGPRVLNAPTRTFWYQWRLPRLLRRLQADVFIGARGIISLRSKLPQVLWLHDLMMPWHEGNRSGAYTQNFRRGLPRMLQQARSIVLPLHCHQPLALALVPGIEARITISGMAPAGPIRPASPEEASHIKQQFTGGAEYLLCQYGWQQMPQAIELLLAFSAFKKRLQTGMKLVLAGQGPAGKDWIEKLSTYKYRHDVILFTETAGNHFQDLLKAAYGHIYLPQMVTARGLLPGLAAGVPTITLPLPAIQEMAGEAALYVTTAQGENLAARMMQLYKDENQRNRLVRLSLERAAEYTPEKVAQKLWDSILAAV